MSACVEPELLVSFASGRLSGDALERVEAHLDGCNSCRAALAAVAGMESGATATATGPRGSLAELPPGAVVGRYEVLELAGAGGMGVIYSALDPTLNRKVALKLVRPDRFRSGDGAARLLAEAKAMAKVVHPEVLPVFDAGTFGDQVFIAMEWVQGRTLRAWLRERQRPWREALALFIRAGRGLSAAHRAGILHRDFKPENVLLGDDGRLRVGDFGLAEEVRDAPRAGAEVAGTIGYIAPEVLRGEPASAAADQFSFCVALQQALQGQAPRAVERAVARGLVPQPDGRHPSMDALVSELERHARPRGKAWLAAAALVPAIAVGAAALHESDAQRCGGAAAKVEAVWNEGRKAGLLRAAGVADRATAARVAELLDGFSSRWVRAHRQACEATRVSGEQSELLLDLETACLQQKLAGVDALLVALERSKKGAFSSAIEATQDAVPIARCSDLAWLMAGGGQRLAPDVRARASQLRASLARTRQLLVLGPWDEGRASTEALVTEAKTLGAKAVEGEAHLLLAEFLRKQRSKLQQTAAIEAQLDEAILAGTEAQYPHLLAEAWLQRMRMCTQDGRFDEADKAEKNLAANLRALGTDAWLQGRHDVALGSLLMRQGRLQEALQAYAQANQMVALLSEQEARLLSTEVLSGEALVHLTLGDIATGARVLELALAKVEERFGLDDAKSAELHHNLAEAELSRDDLESAARHLDRAGAIWAAVHGAQNPRIAINETLRAHHLLALGRYDDALAALDRAMAIFTKHQLEGEYAGLRVLCAEGEVRLAKGDAAGSEAALRKGIALAPTAAGRWPLDEAACHRALGETLSKSGDAAGARAAFERALALYAAAHSAGPWVHKTRVGLAELDAREGHKDAARAALEEALAALDRQGLERPTRVRARLALARILDGGDAAEKLRAEALAQKALGELEAAGAAQAEKKAEVDRWLAARRR